MLTRSFYFLRHGETETNAKGIVTGALDVELTPLGRSQALAAARALAGEPITTIYSSPLRRARETAEPVAQALGLPVTIVAEFTERGQGDLEGRPRGARIDAAVQENAEDPGEFSARVLQGLTRLKGRVPLVVAHLGVFRVLCRTAGITDVESASANALPLRFEPLAAGGWKIEAVRGAR
ncbi:MAG: histidine phosphatase family protein [Burkholderiales bacterium]|nr:histidine phosphatase family protein [Burkholderiales bacterium]